MHTMFVRDYYVREGGGNLFYPERERERRGN
jgi:hypothetical protein